MGNASERREIIGGNIDWSGLEPINQFAAATQSVPTAGLVVGAGNAYGGALYATYQTDIRWDFLVNRNIVNAERILRDFKDGLSLRLSRPRRAYPKAPDMVIGKDYLAAEFPNWTSDARRLYLKIPFIVKNHRN